MTRTPDKYIAAAFRNACVGEQYAVVGVFIDKVNRDADELQQAEENPPRVRCPKCTGGLSAGKHCGDIVCPLRERE